MGSCDTPLFSASSVDSVDGGLCFAHFCEFLRISNRDVLGNKVSPTSRRMFHSCFRITCVAVNLVFPSLYLLAVVSVVSVFSLFIIFLLRVNVTLFHTNIGKCDLLVDCTRGWLLIGATKWNVATVHSTPLGRVYGPELRPPMLFGESMGWRGNRGWLLH